MSSKLKRQKFSKYLCFHGGRYLGSSLVDQPTGEEATSSAIKTISTMVKKQDRKLDRVAPTMLGRLQAMLPAAGGGGGRFWGLGLGAGCRSARTRLAHGGGRGGAGCTVVQKAQARCSLASTSSQGSFCSSSASSHFIPFEKERLKILLQVFREVRFELQRSLIQSFPCTPSSRTLLILLGTLGSCCLGFA